MVEDKIIEWLGEHEIYPFSVLYSKKYSFVKIDFHTELDRDSMLGLVGYEKMCDRSGILVEKETIIFKDNILFRHVGKI